MPVTSAGKGQPSCSWSNMTAVTPRAGKGFPGPSTARDVLKQEPVHANLCSYRSAQPLLSHSSRAEGAPAPWGRDAGLDSDPLPWDSKAELHHCVLQQWKLDQGTPERGNRHLTQVRSQAAEPINTLPPANSSRSETAVGAKLPEGSPRASHGDSSTGCCTSTQTQSALPPHSLALCKTNQLFLLQLHPIKYLASIESWNGLGGKGS